MSDAFLISGEYLTLPVLHEILATRRPLALTDNCQDDLRNTRHFLEHKIAGTDKAYYGINTGFGSLYNVRIEAADLTKLQSNLVRSHAAGAGDAIPKQVARAALLLKIMSLAKGRSGVRLELLQRLIDYYNKDLIPVMYTYGSLGASGDLAPLAHLALTLIGDGAFYGKDGELPAREALAEHGMSPVELQAKEGLAMINGTQFTCGYALELAYTAVRLLDTANMCAALSLDGFNCNPEAFDERIHAARGQSGQATVAATIRHYLHDSAIASDTDKQLQDPYAFRCTPQVHGASLDALTHCREIIEKECNAVTDNPLIFADSDAILSGGNFHGQPLALVLDYLSFAMAELGSISERRTYQLLSGQRGLPDYLTTRSGVQSGLMIAQYTAASLTDRNRLLCAPASTGNAITSKGQEDHVSMSANAAIKAYEICRNCKTVLSIEFLTAMQALDFREAKTATALDEVREAYRTHVPHIREDTVVRELVTRTEHFLDLLYFDQGAVLPPKTLAQNSV